MCKLKKFQFISSLSIKKGNLKKLFNIKIWIGFDFFAFLIGVTVRFFLILSQNSKLPENVLIYKLSIDFNDWIR